MDLPWQVAQAALGMASVMDTNDPQVRAIADEGREIMVRLGARPFVTTMDVLLAGGSTQDPAPEPAGEASVSTAERPVGGSA